MYHVLTLQLITFFSFKELYFKKFVAKMARIYFLDIDNESKFCDEI